MVGIGVIVNWCWTIVARSGVIITRVIVIVVV